MKEIPLHFTPDQICALNNALRRELETQQRLPSGPERIGQHEYVQHLDSALRIVTAGWERAIR